MAKKQIISKIALVATALIIPLSVGGAASAFAVESARTAHNAPLTVINTADHKFEERLILNYESYLNLEPEANLQLEKAQELYNTYSTHLDVGVLANLFEKISNVQTSINTVKEHLNLKNSLQELLVTVEETNVAVVAWQTAEEARIAEENRIAAENEAARLAAEETANEVSYSSSYNDDANSNYTEQTTTAVETVGSPPANDDCGPCPGATLVPIEWEGVTYWGCP